MMQPQPQQQQQEIVFYQDASPIMITSQRLVLGGQTYLNRNVSSVNLTQKAPAKGFFFTLVIIGFITVLVGLGMMVFIPNIGFLYFLPMLAGLTVALVGIGLINSATPIFALRLGLGGAEKEVLTSKDYNYLGAVANTINVALTYR